eukprot:scaffold1793_cov245-Pinguiococcus_pyrenoidosus.AAC.4
MPSGGSRAGRRTGTRSSRIQSIAQQPRKALCCCALPSPDCAESGVSHSCNDETTHLASCARDQLIAPLSLSVAHGRV